MNDEFPDKKKKNELKQDIYWLLFSPVTADAFNK